MLLKAALCQVLPDSQHQLPIGQWLRALSELVCTPREQGNFDENFRAKDSSKAEKQLWNVTLEY
jgi:hypothetical protein